MNLQKLFELQKQLDEHIYEEHPVQDGEDRLAKKILALQVELGELAQNWRGFKFWSKDQEPRTVESIPTDWDDDGTPTEWNVNPHKNPLLEEYVDCLHFILSIGLEHEEYLDPVEYEGYVKENDNIVEQFHQVFKSVSDYEWYRDETNYYEMTCQLLGLGEMLGFTWEQIEQSYLEKNEINHQDKRRIINGPSKEHG